MGFEVLPCVSLGKFLRQSVPQVPICKMEVILIRSWEYPCEV